MKIPDLCAQCGQNPPSFQKEIKDSVITWKALLGVILGIGGTMTTISYTVPMCNACHRKRLINKVTSGILVVVGLVIMGVSFASLLGQGPIINIPLLASILARFGIKAQEMTFFVLIILGTAVTAVGVFMSRNKMASTDGKTLRFYNKHYQKAFAELNPHLVKTKR